MARNPSPTVEVKYPDEFPTDKQFWVITKMLRDNPPAKRPPYPITRIEASELINRLKNRKARA
jgi:hypothetical protein